MIELDSLILQTSSDIVILCSLLWGIILIKECNDRVNLCWKC